MQEGQLAIGRNQQQAIGFGLLAGDLGQELRPGDADGDRQADAVAHRRAQVRGDLHGGAGHPPQSRDIEERLVHAQRLDDRRGVVEDLEHRLAGRRVCRHTRRHDDGVRAQCPRLTATHCGAHTVGLGFIARRQHDATADEHRPAAQRGVVTLFDRRIERVEISVQDGRFRRPCRHEHMFASGSD